MFRSLWVQTTQSNKAFATGLSSRPISTSRRAFSIQSVQTDNTPLSGVRVLELGQLVAGPFAGQLLG